jgi:hypothetical protein
MELTWIAVLASLLMAAAAACVFIFAVKKDYFRNIEDAKYQVFWSDLEDGPQPRAALPLAALPVAAKQEKRNDGGSAKSR